jgi:hypothetical protein
MSSLVACLILLDMSRCIVRFAKNSREEAESYGRRRWTVKKKSICIVGLLLTSWSFAFRFLIVRTLVGCAYLCELQGLLWTYVVVGERTIKNFTRFRGRSGRWCCGAVDGMDGWFEDVVAMWCFVWSRV